MFFNNTPNFLASESLLMLVEAPCACLNSVCSQSHFKYHSSMQSFLNPQLEMISPCFKTLSSILYLPYKTQNIVFSLFIKKINHLISFSRQIINALQVRCRQVLPSKHCAWVTLLVLKHLADKRLRWDNCSLDNSLFCHRCHCLCDRHGIANFEIASLRYNWLTINCTYLMYTTWQLMT